MGPLVRASVILELFKQVLGQNYPPSGGEHTQGKKRKCKLELKLDI